MPADLRITQLVDGNVGVHMMIAKSYLTPQRITVLSSPCQEIR